MNIKVQRQKPSRNEGAQGELRLVILSRGSWLFIRGGNQWYTLALMPNEAAGTVDRRLRAELQKDIRFVSEEVGGTAGDYGGDDASDPGGSIMRPGKRRGSIAPLGDVVGESLKECH